MVLGLCSFLLWPAESFGRAFVRFVHAVPGVATASVQVTYPGGSPQTVGSIGFGQATPWLPVASGRVRWALVKSGSTLAHGAATIGHGAYDIVALAKPSGVALGIYSARGGKAGTSLVRVIHAAPELGSPELEFDGKVVLRSLGFTVATPYLSVPPGTHSVAAMKAGDTAPLLSVKDVRLQAGKSYSAVVVGSRGQMVRALLLADHSPPATSSKPAAPAKRPSSRSHSAGTTVTVQRGDSLWAIAKRRLKPGASNEAIYQELVKIWNLNAQRIGTGDPNLIFPGQRLTMPK